MPATVVNIVVTLRDKEEPPTPVTHTIEATINGNATEGNTITLNVTYDGDPCTGYTLTDVSDSNDLITIDGKNIKLLKAGTAKVKVTYEGTEKVISITIEADTCQSLASIYKELGTELTKS